MKKEKDIAIGLVLNAGKLLMLERKDTNPMWDHKWEFPGGKIEKWEAPESAVKREVEEETGLSVRDSNFVGLHHHDWNLENGDILTVHLHCFMCEVDSWEVVLENRASYGHTWIDPFAIDNWDLLEANADLTRALLWPRLNKEKEG